MRLSPHQEQAIKQADVGLSMMNMPTYTMLLHAIDKINEDVLRSGSTVGMTTLMQRVQKAVDESEVFIIFKGVPLP